MNHINKNQLVIPFMVCIAISILFFAAIFASNDIRLPNFNINLNSHSQLKGEHIKTNFNYMVTILFKISIIPSFIYFIFTITKSSHMPLHLLLMKCIQKKDGKS